MKYNFSPQLMEESVFRHLNHKERSGYRAEYDEYHSLADPIYELPEDDREEAFAKINKLFFIERLKLGDHVFRALEAVGLIPKRRRTSRKSRLNAPAEETAVIQEGAGVEAEGQAETVQPEGQVAMEKSVDSEAVSESTEVALAENEPVGDVSDKDHAGAVKDVFAVDCDFDGGKFMVPEGPPQRPEIIEMV